MEDQSSEMELFFSNPEESSQLTPRPLHLLNSPFPGAGTNQISGSSPMSYQNGTPPATDMSVVPPPAGPTQDQAKTTLW